MAGERTTHDRTDPPQVLDLEDLLREDEELTTEDAQEVRGGFHFTQQVTKASPKLF